MNIFFMSTNIKLKTFYRFVWFDWIVCKLNVKYIIEFMYATRPSNVRSLCELNKFLRIGKNRLKIMFLYFWKTPLNLIYVILKMSNKVRVILNCRKIELKNNNKTVSNHLSRSCVGINVLVITNQGAV